MEAVITVLPGDGIGPEVTAASRQVLEDVLVGDGGGGRGGGRRRLTR